MTRGAYEQIKEGLEDALDWVNNFPKKPSWRELIEEREQTERLERERQLEEGRKAWLQIQQEIKINNSTT